MGVLEAEARSANCPSSVVAHPVEVVALGDGHLDGVVQHRVADGAGAVGMGAVGAGLWKAHNRHTNTHTHKHARTHARTHTGTLTHVSHIVRGVGESLKGNGRQVIGRIGRRSAAGIGWHWVEGKWSETYKYVLIMLCTCVLTMV
jgi:hypothetical protein